MSKLNLYLFNLSLKYIFYNILIISIFIIFINIIEISRIVENQNSGFINFLYLTILKYPSVINQSIPFVIVVAISFLFRNLINKNEFISMRNIGYSIFDIFIPIGLSVFLIGIFFLIIINPISTLSENKLNQILNKKEQSLYSIKITDNEMWIKNDINDSDSSFINIKNIDLKDMKAKNIKILLIENKNKIFIKSKEGNFKKNNFVLKDVTLYDINNENLKKVNNYNFKINFSKENIINSIDNYKLIPFYKYLSHSKILQKFNLYSSEIGLFYISEILKPFFIVMLAFVSVGVSGKFKRNENFFKILFLSILIGFLIYLFKEIISKLTITLSINFLVSYIIIFFVPFLIGLYQVIKIEND